MYNKTKSEQHALADEFDDGNKYDVIDIDTQFLKTQEQRKPDERMAESVQKNSSYVHEWRYDGIRIKEPIR